MYRFDDVLDKVAATDDAHQTGSIENGDAPEMVVDETFADGDDIVVDVEADDVLGHVVSHLTRSRSGPGQDPHDVLLGHDADQLSIRIDDRNAGDVVLHQQLDDFGKSGLRRDGYDVR